MKKQLLNLTMLLFVLLMGGAKAVAADTETVTIYYENNYEDQTQTWKASTLNRYTPIIETEDKNHYMTVNQDQRYNNGCTLTSTETNEKVAAGTNFTFICKVKLGASGGNNAQNSTAFNIYDATGSTKILNLAEVTAGATDWTINGNSDQKAKVSAGGAKGLADLSWITIQVTYQDGKTFLTIKDAEENILNEYDKTLITTTSPKGGLGKLEFVTSRYYANFAIDDIVVRTVESTDVPEESTIDYTINYSFDNNVILTNTGDSYKGTVINAESPINVNGQKYYFADDATTSLTLVEDASKNVLNVNLRKAYEYSYTVTNNLGEELVNTTGIEGESVQGNFLKYVNKEGTLYEAKANDKNTGYYKYSFIPNKNGFNYNIEYSKSNTNNVVYYSEGENIEGMTATDGSLANVRCSNGKGGFCSEAATLITLQPGKYNVYTNVWGTKGQIFTVKAGETTIHTNTTTGALNPGNTEFQITESATITMEGGNKNSMLDYIYIVKTADVLPLSSDYKLSTYAPETDVDLTNEAGVKFYAAKVNGTSVALTEVTGKVKAGTGLVVENNNNAASVTLATATDGEEVSENALVGVTADMTGADFEGKNAYVLVSDTKFQKVDATTQGTLAKGKAYLLTGSTAAARLLTIGNPTAINGVTEKAAEGTDAIYNIQGVRVDKADASGLYIVNGKKYIKK